MYLDDLGFEVVKIAVIQVKLAFEGTIRDAPLTLEHGDGLRQHLLERYTCPPCVWIPAPLILLRSILSEDPRGLHEGKQGQYEKAVRLLSIPSDTLPQKVSAHSGLSSPGAGWHTL